MMPKEAIVAVPEVSRPEAISRLRKRLKDFVDVDQCVCSAVGRLGIFCGGFGTLSDEALNERFDWIAKCRPGVSRESLEHLASLYHAGRQEATGAEICCDVETREHTFCDGWNSFDNAALEKFHLALTGEPVRIQ